MTTTTAGPDAMDLVAVTRRRATVAKVLRDRHPGQDLHHYIDDARAILQALDEDDTEPASPLVLTVEQEIRDRAYGHARKRYPTAAGPELFARAAEIAHFIQHGHPAPPSS